MRVSGILPEPILRENDHDVSVYDFDKVLVHFERPTEEGFDSARCGLPSYNWLYNEGYSESEISFFNRYLESDAHLIYK